MNKFVKGAKNLAFALSFVTVAACGNVKKADLEALEKKINEKFDGVGENGRADDNQGYVRRNDIKDFVKNTEVEAVRGEVENLKNGTKFLGSLNNCKDKEILSKLFGNESLKFDVFKGYDYKLIFADNGTSFALDVMLGGKKDDELSIKKGAFANVEKEPEFGVCKNLGFEGKCFVGDESKKLSVAAADKSDTTKLKVGGSDVSISIAVAILKKAKELGVDVKGLFNKEVFGGGKIFGVDYSQGDNEAIKEVVGLIADVDDKNEPICSFEGKNLKFIFGGEKFDIVIKNG